MSTKPREQSESDFYHVMQRGVGLFNLFEDDHDRNRYVEELKKAVKDTNAEIYAWCLMSNHTHLLVKANIEALACFMRQLGACYARYFNSRHSRPGHLFQDRYKSVPVTDDSQLLATVRYIHRNPAHHDGRTLCGDYPWSSYREYVNGSAVITHTEMVLEMLGGAKAFREFHALDDGKRYLDIDTLARTSDDQARTYAQQALLAVGVKIPLSKLGSLPRPERDAAIKVMLSLGLSLRQTQRLTGISYNAIRTVAKRAPTDHPRGDRLPQG